MNKLKPRLLRDNRAPPGPNRTELHRSLRSFFQLETKGGKGKKREGKGKKGKGREGKRARKPASSRFRVFPSIILFSILLSFESTRATRSPPLPLQSASSIFMPRMAFLAENFPPVVQNGLHYHNLSDGTPTPPRGLGGFNVIINQNPR